VFHTGDGAGMEGLKAEHFSNTNLSGDPVLTRIDPQVQFDWNSAASARGVPMKGFALRRTGTLTPPGLGNYTFTCQGHPEKHWGYGPSADG
jgi:beta-glucosidase